METASRPARFTRNGNGNPSARLRQRHCSARAQLAVSQVHPQWQRQSISQTPPTPLLCKSPACGQPGSPHSKNFNPPALRSSRQMTLLPAPKYPAPTRFGKNATQILPWLLRRRHRDPPQRPCFEKSPAFRQLGSPHSKKCAPPALRSSRQMTLLPAPKYPAPTRFGKNATQILPWLLRRRHRDPPQRHCFARPQLAVSQVHPTARSVRLMPFDHPDKTTLLPLRSTLRRPVLGKIRLGSSPLPCP